MKKLISVVGTTGIGKTKLAINLAKYFRTEIISCDSRQFYREMIIGTATPSPEELAEVPHHFIGNLSVQNHYSIGQYERDALTKLDKLFQQYDVVILVGGSMMYEKAILKGLHNLPEANPENQRKLEQIFAEEGLAPLQKMLLENDPEYYSLVDLENPRRLFRALDIIWQTGKSYTENISSRISARDFEVIRIGIEAPREIIYERINQRVDQMVERGLLEEVKSLLSYQNNTSLQTVGYSELFKYFNGTSTLEFALEEIKKNSRRFAKRQLTWYRKEENIHWVNFENSFAESLSLLKTLTSKIKIMSDTLSNMLELGTKAPFFELPNPSQSNEVQSLEELKGSKGTLVFFMCNHCPFVLHVIDKLAELYEDYQEQGIEFIAINANDVEKYPADSPEKMIDFQMERKFDFPYLYDESQSIAKAYNAACTPDFFFFDEKLDLVYRGQMDDSRPGNQKEITGEDLIIAFESLLAGAPQEELQKPSMGCNIKWKS